MNPDLDRVRILIGKLELIGRVDFGVQLDRLDRRAFESQDLRAIATTFGSRLPGFASERVTVSGKYCSEMMRRTAAVSGSIKTIPPFRSFGELGNVLMKKARSFPREDYRLDLAAAAMEFHDCVQSSQWLIFPNS